MFDRPDGYHHQCRDAYGLYCIVLAGAGMYNRKGEYALKNIAGILYPERFNSLNDGVCAAALRIACDFPGDLSDSL